MSIDINQPFSRIETISFNEEQELPLRFGVTFLYVLKGAVGVTMNGSSFYLREDDVMMALPKDAVSILASGSNIVVYYLMRSDFFALGSSVYDGSYICNSALDKERDYETIRSLLAGLAVSARDRSVISGLEHRQMADSLLVYLNRYHFVTGSGEDEKGRYSSRIRSILRYLEEHYQETVTLEDLAAITNLTPTYVSRFFREQMGGGFNETVRDIRLEHAAEDLASTGGKISDVAFNNGFSNLNSFNRDFRARFGKSPRDYRRDCQAGIGLDTSSMEVTGRISALAEEQLRMRTAGTAHSSAAQASLSLYPAQEEHVIWNVKTGRTIFPIWRSAVNVGFLRPFIKGRLKEQLMMAHEDIGFRYARVQAVLSDSAIPPLADEKYNFAFFDRYIEIILSCGMYPYLDLTVREDYFFLTSSEHVYSQSAPAGVYTAPAAVSRKINALIRHCINRYGAREVQNWIFEIGYMHDHELHALESPEAFASRFAEASAGIRTLLPEAGIGGVVFNTLLGSDFLNEVAGALERKGVSPDFISVSIFPYERFPSADGSYSVTDFYYTADRDFVLHQIEVIRSVMRRHPGLKSKLYVASIGPEIQNRVFINDSCYQATFLAKAVADLIDSADFLAFWQLSDVEAEYTDISALLFGGTGLLSVDGIPKPGYMVLKCLSDFGTRLIQKNRDYLLCESFAGSYQLMIHNHVHIKDEYCRQGTGSFAPDTVDGAFCDVPTRDISFRLKGLEPGGYKIRTASVCRESGSILDNWVRYGLPDHLSVKDISYLKQITCPRTSVSFCETTDGTLDLHLQLLPQEVRFFEISRTL